MLRETAANVALTSVCFRFADAVIKYLKRFYFLRLGLLAVRSFSLQEKERK